MRWAIAATVLLLAGCASPDSVGTAPHAPGIPSLTSALGFSPAVQVNQDLQEGFEPVMRIGPQGTIYVAMSRGFLAGADGSLASPVYASTDNGTSWRHLPSPLGVRDKAKTEEGDLAIDAEGTVYFVDTHGADNVFTVWNKDGTWRSTTPLQGTLGLDDRPWLAAQGKGVVYYVGNSALSMPAPGDGSPASGSKIWFYSSVDAGTTWSLGHALPGADYCHVAASPADDVTVAAVCTPGGVGVGPQLGVTAYWSHDRGANWRSADLGPLGAAPSQNQPSVSFAPDGTATAAWAVEGASAMRMATFRNDAWTVLAPPQPNGTISPPWIAAGPQGAVGVAAYEQEGHQWYLHAWTAGASTWREWRDPLAVGHDAQPPQDFFQSAMDAHGMLHIVYQRDESVKPFGVGLNPYLQPILHVRQVT